MATPARTLQAALEARIQVAPYDRVNVAMAYVSVAGVRALLKTLTRCAIRESRWLVGLDDVVTQPDAIRLVMGLPNASVRVASLAKYSRRFHPKVLYFEERSQAGEALLMIGSANLTSSALGGNSEAVVFLRAEHDDETCSLAAAWQDLWSQGHVPGTEELAEYKRRYEKTRKIRRQLLEATKPSGQDGDTKPRLVLGDDTAELDPSHAKTCWIECGFITAMGRELEFKAEQGLYFGLDPAGGPPKEFNFRASDGQVVRLRMKFQQNQMWRLQMNNQIPEVRVGLRPKGANDKLGRSEYVAVFERTPNRNLLKLRFIKLTSREFSRLRARSHRLGTVGQTSARMYGWC